MVCQVISSACVNSFLKQMLADVRICYFNLAVTQLGNSYLRCFTKSSNLDCRTKQLMLRENRDIRTSAGDRLHFAISTLRLFQPSVRPGDVRRAADSVVGPQSSDDRGAKSRSKDST